MTESGMSNLARVLRELGRVGADGDEVQREVADHLRGRRHLDDVAEDVVGGGVHVLDLLELLAEAERDRLLAQVGQLAAGDLVGVDPAGGGRAARTRTARRRGGPPPSRARGRRPRRGRARCRAPSGRWPRPAPTAAGWLVVPAIAALAASTASTPASIAASSVASWPPAVSWVCRWTGRSKRSRSAVTSVRAAGARSRPAMSLIARTCAPASTIRSARPQVVVERVELLVRRGRQVAGVAERDLRDRRAGRPDRVDRGPHLLDVVERVEDPEDVDAGGGRLVHEGVGDLRRVRRVADRVAAAQQHLQADVRHRLPQRGEPLPRVLGQEAQRHVVRRPAPRLEAPQLRRHARDVAGDDRQQVAGAHPGREQRLVRVAERRVGDRDGLLLAQGAREPVGARSEQRLAGAVRGGDQQVDVRQLADRVDGDRGLAVRLVDGDVGEVGEQLGAAVGRRASGEQLRVLLDEGRRDVTGPEVRVVENRLQERDVGGRHPRIRNSATARRALDGRREVAAAAGELGQHRVEVRADLGAGVRRAAVEPDARAAGRAVGRDLAGVGAEAVRGVLGGDPALQRGAAQHDGVLGEAEVGQGLAGRDAHLGLHEVDVGDLLGDRVLDLDARVHLDEDVVAVRRAGTPRCRRCGSRSRWRTAPRRRTSARGSRGRGWGPARSR